MFGLTEVQFELVIRLLENKEDLGRVRLVEMDPTNGRVAFVVSSDYRERFP